MKIFNYLLPLLIVSSFSFFTLVGVSEASCWLDPNGASASGQTCNYSLSYVPMIDLPGVTNPTAGQTSFASYVSALYSVAIVVAALLAVIRLVLAGAKYMMTDVVSGKGEAINDIKGSLLGLLIIISAFVILNTINPNLTKIVISPDQQPYAGGTNNSGLFWAPNLGSPVCALYGASATGSTTCVVTGTTVTSDSDTTGNQNTNTQNLIGSIPYPDPVVLITQYASDIDRYLTQSGLMSQFDSQCAAAGKGTAYAVAPLFSSGGNINVYCNP